MTTIIICMLIALVVGQAFVCTIWWFKSELKTAEYYSKLLKEENEKLRQSMFDILAKNAFAKKTPEENTASQEATITKEPDEVPEDIYNLTLEQWIYGAKEDKEGGIDG